MIAFPPQAIGVVVITRLGVEVESRRCIDHNSREDRVWLGKHCYWAFRNGRSIETYAALAPEGRKVYHIGDNTRALFRDYDITDVSNLQAIFDAVEEGLINRETRAREELLHDLQGELFGEE